MSKTARDIPVIGLCRFSYPTLEGTGFKNSSSRNLYDEDRLSVRLSLFENILIPSIAGQTEKDFTLGILIGNDLPMWCARRIEIASQGISQIKLLTKEPFRPHVEICSEAIRSLRPDTDSHVAEFRIDDDDGLGVNFIERVKEIFSAISHRKIGPILELDFPRGYHLHVGQSLAFRETVTPHLTCAQAWLIKPKGDRTLFSQNHFKFWTKGPSLSMPHEHMYIRGVHDFNDSTVRSDAQAISGISYNESIHRLFNISHDNVRNVSRIYRAKNGSQTSGE